ncbi:hypothetical protein FEP38_04334 [Burkholderia multivorans]|nr:hypothetical protein [Burkholderia multivorans]
MACRRVAQRRRQEHSAILRLVLQILAERSAHAEIVERRIAVLRELPVARHGERFVLVVGKHRRQPVGAGLRQMTARAVRLVRIVEQPQAAQLRLREARAALEPAVVLAVVRMERRILDLIARDREHRFGHRELRTVEHARAEQVQELRPVRRLRQLVRDLVDARIRHLDGVQQRTECLLLQRVRAAVPEHSALRYELRCGRGAGHLLRLHDAGRRGRLLRDARCVVVFAGIGADAEVRLSIQVHQRRRRPITVLRHREAARLHVERVRRPVGVIGVVARRTRLLAGRRQRRIEEQRAAELRHRGQRLHGRPLQHGRMRIRAGPVRDDVADRGRRMCGKRDREGAVADDGRAERERRAACEAERGARRGGAGRVGRRKRGTD